MLSPFRGRELFKNGQEGDFLLAFLGFPRGERLEDGGAAGFCGVSLRGRARRMAVGFFFFQEKKGL